MSDTNFFGWAGSESKILFGFNFYNESDARKAARMAGCDVPLSYSVPPRLI